MKQGRYLCSCFVAVFALCQISGQSNRNNDDDNFALKSTDIIRSGYSYDRQTDLLSNSSALSNIIGYDENEFSSQHGFYLGAVYSIIKKPTFRPIQKEVVVPQTAYMPGFFGGYWLDTWHLGIGARAFIWHTDFEDFATEEMEGSETFISITNPTFTHMSLDLMLEWIVPRKSFLGIYGLAGLASSKESYFVSGASPIFEEYNGFKHHTEFDYSYGLGIRISPIKWISIISEIRWIPGDATTPLELLYSKNGVNYYGASGETIIKNHTPIISAGLSIHPGIFKRKDASDEK